MKKLMSIMLLSLMFFSILNYSPTISYACSCAEPGPVKEELERSSAVFSGKVIEMVDKNRNKLIQSSADLIAVKFEVAEVWKGKSNSQMIVYTERDSASCGFEFEQNQEYLVYANESEGQIRVNLCSRTNLLSAASTDILELGKGEKPTKVISPDTNENNNNLYIIALVSGLLLVGIVYVTRRRKK